MKKVASYALGCKVNQYESEAIGEIFQSRGYELVDIGSFADIYIINTCTVTNFGDKKSRQLIRRVKRQNPDAIVAVVGCYAQTMPEEVKEIEGVNIIIGTKGREEIADLVEAYQWEQGVVSKVSPVNRERVFEPLKISQLGNRARAYLKIQDGCSQFCTYCIIPYARGPIRSRDPQDILREVRLLAENGFLEVVLVGIHVASYGKDRKDISLLDILRKVHEIEGIQRIRFSSIEPGIITEEFVESIRQMPKVCRHFHLALQSGCDKILAAMNRRYTTKDYRRAVGLLRQAFPQVGLTTDMIVGFPGETQEDFQQSLTFAEEMEFSKIHVFPYSPKRGTPAEKMPNQVPPEEKHRRSKELIAVSDQYRDRFIAKHMGKEMEVLLEQEVEPGIYEGYTDNYIRVRVQGKENLRNKLVPVVITGQKEDTAFGAVRAQN